MNACNNIVGLARELGIGRRLLYNWRERLDETDPPPQRSRELILRSKSSN
jgi:transposase-like protein